MISATEKALSEGKPTQPNAVWQWWRYRYLPRVNPHTCSSKNLTQEVRSPLGPKDIPELPDCSGMLPSATVASTLVDRWSNSHTCISFNKHCLIPKVLQWSKGAALSALAKTLRAHWKWSWRKRMFRKIILYKTQGQPHLKLHKYETWTSSWLFFREASGINHRSQATQFKKHCQKGKTWHWDYRWKHTLQEVWSNPTLLNTSKS